MKPEHRLVSERYSEVFGADVKPSHANFLVRSNGGNAVATLGYTSAASGALFLERYLDVPVEHHVSRVFGQLVERSAIVEFGNLAARDPRELVQLWACAAASFENDVEFAVATLTAPLREMFRRIGLPFRTLAQATSVCVGACNWGSYYDLDPMICAGRIAEGRIALTNFLARKKPETAQ